MLKKNRKTWIVLAVVLLTPFWMWLAWLLWPKTKLVGGSS